MFEMQRRSSRDSDDHQDLHISTNDVPDTSVKSSEQQFSDNENNVENPSLLDESINIKSSTSSVEQKFKWVIFPNNKWIKHWDTLMLFLLVVVSFTIPYQIGISAGYYIIKNLAWMIVNLCIDIIFLVDTFLYFFRAYRSTTNGHVVFNLSKIRSNYLRTFFIWNILGNFPSTLFFYLKWHDAEDESDFKGDYSVIVKILDLLKLFRLARLMHIFSASEAFNEFKQNRRSQARLELIKYSFLLVVMSHWFACTWCFLVFAQAGTFSDSILENNNWITNWYNANYAEGSINPVGWTQDLDRYVLSLFWSIQSITSIGYGNISPFTPVEWWFGCLLMLLAGVLWAYTIGGLVGIAAALEVQTEMHRNRIDQANEMIRHFSQNDPTENDNSDEFVIDTQLFGKRVKKFIQHQKMYSHHLTSISDINEAFPVIDTLSPELQRLSSFMLLRDHLETVPYLSSRYLSIRERSVVARGCVLLEFDSSEIIQIGEGINDVGRGIFVILSGTAFAFRGKPNSFSEKRKKIFIITTGNAFGLDQVLLEDGAKGSEGFLQFVTYTRVMLVPRDVVLAALRQNRKAWADCARWKYLHACLRSSHNGIGQIVENIQ